MSLENSTFKTSRVLDNEIIKASDFEFAFEQLVENVSKATQMLLESNQDFVINGKVLPAGGLNVSVSPIYGVCKTSDGGKPFGRTEETDETIGFEGSESGRVDIIEVQGDWQTYDNQQRAFNDPDTDVQTYQYVDTKRLMKPVYQVKKGVEGSETAPDHDTGWVKLAEVKIRAGVTVIASTDIKNITADVAGMDNDDWTNEKDITYNIGYISDINARFRVQHNEDGTHADDSINSDSLDIGTGAKQINGNVLPIGGSVSIPNESIASSDSILSVIVKAAAMITTLYNAYLKYGNYSFKGDLSVSSIADANNVLTKPITIHAEGDGTAVIKVDGNAVFSIDANGKLSTNGYTASSANHIVTKTVTDGLKSLIDALDLRVTALENTADATVYANGVISSGSTGRFNPDSTSIFAATTTNITLSGSQTIDGTTPTDGVTILVKNQTDATENGFYQYSSNSAWSRINGFLSPESLKSKLFTVSSGTVNGNKMFYVPRVNFTDPTSFGTDDIEFLEYFGAVKAVANKVIIRDANGRAQVAAPSAASDIARKQEVDAVQTNVNNLFGNVIGTDLGTAAVGTCTTFARSDHVHPVTGLATVECVGNYYGIGYAGTYTGWLRTPKSGLLPYASNANGCSSLGTSAWPFLAMYAKTFCGNLSGNAETATDATNATNAIKAECVKYSCLRPTSANISDCTIGFTKFLATSAMTEGKPMSDGHIIHMSWDSSSGWGAQFFIPNNLTSAGRVPQYRGKCNTDWSNWKNFITEDNIGSQSVKYACCASYNGSGVAFGTAATCAATAFLSASGCAADSAKLGGTAASSYLKTTGCAADSAKLGGTAASCYALKSGYTTCIVRNDPPTGSTVQQLISLKWCVFCNAGCPQQCIQLAVCGNQNTSNVLVFLPPDYFYISCSGCKTFFPPVFIDCVTTSWTKLDTIKTSVANNCFFPACTTSKSVSYIRVYPQLGT